MANRAYLGPRLGRRQQPRAQARPMVTPGMVPGLTMWLRADLGYNDGAKTWTCQASGKVFTSSGAPIQTTEASLNGQTVIQFAAGGADTFVLGSNFGAVALPYCWLGVFRIISGTSQYNLCYATNNFAQFMVTPTTTAVYIRSISEAVSSSVTSDLGTTPHAMTIGSGADTARLDGTALTNTALTNSMALLSPETNVGYSVASGQIAEVILARVDTLTSLAPYIKSRYGLTL